MSLTTRLSARIAHRTTPGVPSPLRIVQNASPINKERGSTPAKGIFTKGSLRKATNRKTSPTKAEQIVDNLNKVRKCTGCKTELDNHLFLALHPKSDQDFKEKCFKCRRIDAISDFLKAHNKNANGTAKLTAALQKEHILNQKEACQKWKRIMAGRGVNIGDDVVDAVMEAVMKHPALVQAAKMFVTMVDKTSADKQPVKPTTDLTKPASDMAKPTNPIKNTNANPVTSTDSKPTSAAELPALNSDPLLIVTIHALQRAVDHLSQACFLPARHFDNVVHSVFKREFEYRAVTGWANMLVETVELAIATKNQWQEIEENELDAVRTLAGMKYDSYDDQ